MGLGLSADDVAALETRTEGWIAGVQLAALSLQEQTNRSVTLDSGGGTDLYRLNAAGGGRIRLTKTPVWVTARPDKAKPWHNVSPTWSPDGSQIAFLTDRTGRWEIWTMNGDGSNPHPMFSEEINNQLHFSYDFVAEQVLSWR